MPFFRYQGQRIAYTEFASDVKPPAEAAQPGAGRRGAAANGTLSAAKGRPLILLHGLMLSPGNAPSAGRRARPARATG